MLIFEKFRAGLNFSVEFSFKPKKEVGVSRLRVNKDREFSIQ